MKMPLPLLLLFLTVLPIKAESQMGSVIRDIKVAEVLQKAVPELRYKSGDENWNGGMFSSNFSNGIEFDTNTSYTVFTYKADANIGSSTAIAEAISKYLVANYKLEIEKPAGSTWNKEIKGLGPSNYACAFIRSSEMKGQNAKSIEYITIQVCRLNGPEFGITLNYATVK